MRRLTENASVKNGGQEKGKQMKQLPDKTGGIWAKKKGSETMPESAYEMIIAVANQGYIEPIMEAARSAGAGGGTVIHAKGTGMEGMGKFFGVSLAAGKRNDLHCDKNADRSRLLCVQSWKKQGWSRRHGHFYFPYR